MTQCPAALDIWNYTLTHLFLQCHKSVKNMPFWINYASFGTTQAPFEQQRDTEIMSNILILA